MESAKPIDNAFVPRLEWQENHGTRRLCLDFHYDHEVLPYREWPRALAYKGVTYVRTGYNSDTNTVHYKHGNVATPA